VRLLPKTLFGEKYVDLVPPSRPAAQHLDQVSAISEDQTKPTLEIDQALNDLLPMLRAVPPVELNNTLIAIATALSGRGQQLGQTIDELNSYLHGFNPHLPRLAHDMRSLSGVASTYATAAPALLRMLDNLTVTAHTVIDQRQQLSAFLTDVTGAADATHDLLARNQTNLIAVNRVSRPVLSLLARYSPEFPCFFRGYAKLIPRIHAAVSKHPVGISHSAHVVVEFVPSYPTYSRPIDLPQFGDKRGPSCYGLPNPPMSLPVVHYKDGTQDDPRFATQGKVGGKSSQSSPLSSLLSTPGSSRKNLGRAFSPSMGFAGTAQERRTFDQLLGPMLGISSMSVPDIADLLWGPLARGEAVRLR
jgi:phospholipid/cholesterol/gamma-HCH transport system substrate-binding protein